MKPTTIYSLDEDGQLAASYPLRVTSDRIFFEEDTIRRVYPDDNSSGDSPYFEMFMHSGVPTIRFHFAEDATALQISSFWNAVRTKSLIDMMSQRWGSIQVLWGGPGGREFPDDPPTLTIYYDPDDWGFAFLTLHRCLGKTYDDAIQDYNFLRNMFERTQL